MSLTPAQALFEEAIRNAVRPPPDLSVLEWVEAGNRNLSPENCDLPGRFDVDVVPYLREPLDVIHRSGKTVMQKGSQVAWTDGVINNFIGYTVDIDPASVMILFPTDKLAKRYSKKKLAPMIRDNHWGRKFSDARARDSNNTIESKSFEFGHMELVGSNAAANLSDIPIERLIIEEPDRCSRNSSGEGNSLKLAFERTKTFRNRRILLGGSPTIEGQSEIEREMRASDYRRFFIPCPRCGKFHYLQWENVKFDEVPGQSHEVYGSYNPDTARFQCPHCRECYSNAHKNQALSVGEWRPTQDGEYPGFHVPEFLSPFPFASVTDITKKFLEARQAQKRGDDTLMQVWKNTSCGEVWQRPAERLDYAFLLDRGESYQELDKAAEVVVMAVDVQKNRLEAETVAFSKTLENWSVSYDTLMGNPDEEEVWDALLDLMRTTYVHASGARLSVSCTAIDSGGHHTSQVYKFTKRYAAMRAFAVKGRGGPGLPIVVRKSKTKEYGNWLVTLGVDELKGRVYRMLQIPEPGAGFCHFPDWYPDSYYEGLTAEETVPAYHKGHLYDAWELPPGKRNEPLDIRAYAMGALYLIRPYWFKVAGKAKPAAPEAVALGEPVATKADDGTDLPGELQVIEKVEEAPKKKQNSLARYYLAHRRGLGR